ncbi:MAG TPA: glycosyltransferase family 9 protein, partial [Bacteroidota bacterium]
MLTRRYVGPILRENPLVNDVLWYDSLVGSDRPTGDLIRDLQERHFDAALAVHPTPRIAWILARAGIPVRIGTGYRFYSLLFTRRVFDHRRTGERHELEYNLRLLTPLGLTPRPRQAGYEFGITPSGHARASIACILRSFGVPAGTDVAVLHPGSGGSARDWPPENFRRLALNLGEMKNVAVVITGTPVEERVLRKVLHNVSPPVISLAGILQMDQLTALLERAALVVSNSTGPLHLAAALGTPVIGLYPPVAAMSARRWGP